MEFEMTDPGLPGAFSERENLSGQPPATVDAPPGAPIEDPGGPPGGELTES